MKSIKYILFIVLFIGTISISYAQCPKSCAGCEKGSEVTIAEEDEFQDAGDEFQDAGDEFQDAGDEFQDAGDEFQDAGDEFQDTGDEFQDTGDEFQDTGDEFQESNKEFEEANTEENQESFFENRANQWVIAALALTLISGLLVRWAPARKFRLLMLLGTLLAFGFYNSGCPCPIMSFQDLILMGFGVKVDWTSLIWFLGLIPLTYFLGKTWCGWVCHLGAFQEFLFKSSKLEFLKSRRSQKVMKYMRYALVAALLIQLAITQTNWFCKIDPFKVAFNFTSFYTIGWILLGLLLLSSLFIYRPFCKSACPIGLVLGWTSKIPGASVIAAEEGDCIGCKSCDRSCEMDAITRDKKVSYLDNKECIACGECLDSCSQSGLKFHRKNKNITDIIELKRCDLQDKSCDEKNQS